ncbi:MAG: phenylalanine--tRNA ligase beta subunit-related protein [Chitinophagales bacterium]
MTTITLSPDLLQCCPNIHLGCIQSKVTILEEYPRLNQLIEATTTDIASKLQTADIKDLPNIANSRTAYKKLGQDPSRYRLSAEALLRRVVSGKGIYHINNVVDLLNLVSMQSGYSIGGYDADKIEGAAIFGVGELNEPYEAIGKGQFNIHKLPTFRDEQGAFGTPTSDSVRTMVRTDTQHFLMVLIDYAGSGDLKYWMQETVNLLKEFAEGEDVETWVVLT